MVQTKITDYLNHSSSPTMKSIVINGCIHGSEFLVQNHMFYLESKYEPLMVTYEDSSKLVLCCLDLNSGQEVVVHYYRHLWRNPDVVGKIIREIQSAMYLMHHPNILQLESIGIPVVSITDEENLKKIDGRLFTDLYLVYKSDGFEDLHNILITGKMFFNLPKLIYQVLNTLKYIHESVGILHHRLKPRDIFVSAEQNIKLGGFSCAHLIGEEGDTLKDSSAPRKQLCRLAPEELLMCAEFTSCPSVDVWYCGCLLAEIILRCCPFILPENVVQPTKEKQLEYVLALLRPDISEFSFIRCDRCRTDLMEKYEESAKNSNPSLLEMIRESNPWVFSLLMNMLRFDPTKRFSIEHAIEYIVRTNEGIEEEEGMEANWEDMEEVEHAVNIIEEVMTDEDYLRMSDVVLCDENKLREILWAEMIKFNQFS